MDGRPADGDWRAWQCAHLQGRDRSRSASPMCQAADTGVEGSGCRPVRMGLLSVPRGRGHGPACAVRGSRV